MIATFLLAAATAVTGMQLHSGDFTDGGAMSTQLVAPACGGAGHSPSLDWTGAPKGTKSFALIVRDPDAPLPGGFDHWVLYDLPASTVQLSGNATLPAAEVGLSSAGNPAYSGPCPPAGQRHPYVFTLYALDVAHVGSGTPLTAERLRIAIAGHVLATAKLTGTASNP